MRNAVTSGVEVVALGLIVAGTWLIFMPAALIVAGFGLGALAYGASR